MYQNMKVWSRRLGVPTPSEEKYRSLLAESNMEGSVLVAPLAFALKKKTQVSRQAALEGARLMAGILRGEMQGNLYTRLASSGVESERETEKVIKAISEGLTARNKEKSRPSIAQNILNKIR